MSDCCGECDASQNEVEVSSLRRDLAVTRAALAQCATALQDISSNLECDSPCGPYYVSCECGKKTERWCAGCVARVALASPDVEHAVRVEAARDAEVAVLRELADAGLKLRHELLDRYGWINWSAYVPGAGLCICHEVNDRALPDAPTAADVPVVHDSLCASWRAALDAWQGPRDRLAALDALTSERKP